MIELQIISAADAGSNITSVPLKLEDLQVFSIHCDFDDAGLNGTLNIESSNDNSDWISVSGASTSVSSGASHMFNVINAAYKFVRVTWVNSSGTGNLTAAAVIKENPIIGA